MDEAEEEIPIVHNIIGKCKVCGKDIDNAVEPYVTDAEKDVYHVPCYAKLELKQ